MTSSLSFRARFRSRSGISLVEVMIGLSILALSLFLFMMNGTSTKQQAEIEAMKVKAGELNMAMGRFMSLKGPVPAQNQWASLSDADRYLLLRPWISHPPVSLDKYIIEGYSISFPAALRGGSVTLLDAEGNTLAY